VLAMKLLLFVLVGVPPVVQGAFAFGHVIAMTLPYDAAWGVMRILGGVSTTMSRVDSIPG